MTSQMIVFIAHFKVVLQLLLIMLQGNITYSRPKPKSPKFECEWDGWIPDSLVSWTQSWFTIHQECDNLLRYYFTLTLAHT